MHATSYPLLALGLFLIGTVVLSILRPLFINWRIFAAWFAAGVLLIICNALHRLLNRLSTLGIKLSLWLLAQEWRQ